MSYFAAVLARKGPEWVAVEVDLDEVDSLDDVSEAARSTLLEEEPDADDEVLVLLAEQRDEWFGVVRLDLDEDPRVFVSDTHAALRHALGETLLPALVLPRVQAEADPEMEDPTPPGPYGEQDLLADLGLPGDALVGLAAPGAPASEALAGVVEGLGAVAALESVR